MAAICPRVLMALAVALARTGPTEARLGGAGATVLTDSTFGPLVTKHEKVVVDFYNGQDDDKSKQMAELDDAVRQCRDEGHNVPIVRVDASRDAALARKFVPNQIYPQLVWFVHGEATQYHMHARTTKGIVDFMRALDRPAITRISGLEAAEGYNRVVFAQVPQQSPMYRMIEVVAAKNMDKVAFLAMESAANNITFFGDRDDFTGQPQWTETYKGGASVPDFEHWLHLINVRSEPIPEDRIDDDGSVIVVGKTFEELVLRKDKDVFLMVSAPWCGVCRQWRPTWKAFAEAAKNTPGLVVAKMDGDRNTILLEEFRQMPSYPALVFVRAGQRTPQYFSGNRTVEDLAAFVNQHGTAHMHLASSDELLMIEL